jgi:hypothetical protein
MFRFTRKPSSGSHSQYLAKTTHLVQCNNNPNPTGIYQLKCNTCNRAYVGQSGRPITREHLRYIRNNRHEFGLAEETLKLLKPCSKGSRTDRWESLFIHLHHKHNILITKQQASNTNPQFELASIPCDLVQPA